MSVKTTIPITEARRNIYKIVEAVQAPGKYYTLTEKGRPKAVLISAEEYESLIETIEVMEMFPNLEKTAIQARKDLAVGRTVSLDEVIARLKRRLNSKNNSKHYAISTRALQASH